MLDTWEVALISASTKLRWDHDPVNGAVGGGVLGKDILLQYKGLLGWRCEAQTGLINSCGITFDSHEDLEGDGRGIKGHLNWESYDSPSFK